MKEIFSKNEIYTNVKDRLTNPFIFSFAISWLFWNWKIVIGLIWYNSENIILLGYNNYADLVIKNSNHWNNYYYPVLFAFGYIVFLPILKWGIDIINAFFLRRNQDSVLKLTKTGYIPTLKYYSLKDSYDEYINRLSKLVQDESVTSTENINFKSEMIDLKSEINIIKNKENELERLTSPEILEGAWYIIMLNDNNKPRHSLWYIDHGRVRIQHDITSDYSFEINSYICNPFSKMALIQLKGAKNDNTNEIINYSNLKWSEDFQSIKTITSPSIEMFREKPRNF